MAASHSSFYADDGTYYEPYGQYLNPNQYEYHEVDPSEVPSSDLLHEMQNMPPPQAVIQEETPHLADSKDAGASAKKKTSRFKKNTSKEVDKVQAASIKDRTLKQTLWGVNVFRGKQI